MPIETTDGTLELTEREVAIAQGRDPDEITTDETPEVETSVEDTVDAEASEPSSEPAEETWINAEITELADSYGFTGEDMKLFESEAEFRRAGMLFDRQMLSKAEPEPKAEVKAEPKAEEKPGEKPERKRLDPKVYRDAGYDEETIALVEALAREQELNDEREKALNELREWQKTFQTQSEQEELARATQDFHLAVDGLDEKLFGRVFDEAGAVRDVDQKYHDNRAKVWEAAQTIQAGIQSRAAARGVPAVMPSHKTLMQRAFQLAFPDAVTEKRVSGRVEAATKQSAKRRTVGNQGGARPSRTAMSDDPKDLANHPDIVRWWNEHVGNK